MALFLLIRHGETDWVGNRLPGRLPDVHLNRQGRNQAARLPARLSNLSIDLICSSPLERARETASPLAEERQLEPRICEPLTEIDYGEWTGRAIEDLLDSGLWKSYHNFRGGTRIPGGELMLEVQSRVVTELLRIHQELPQGTVAVFSHGDPIKMALAHFAGIEVESSQRLSITPASVSPVAVNAYGAQILAVNLTETIPSI